MQSVTSQSSDFFRRNVHYSKSFSTKPLITKRIPRTYFFSKSFSTKPLNNKWISSAWNSVIANSVVNEHSVITNKFLGLIGHFTTQIDPIITNPGYNERKCRSRVVRYYQVWVNYDEISSFLSTDLGAIQIIRDTFWHFSDLPPPLCDIFQFSITDFSAQIALKY